MATQLQDLQVRIRAELAALRESLAPAANRRISMREKQFTLPDGTTHRGPIVAVILDHRNVNRFYTRPFDATKLTPPDCFAIAKRFEDLSPNNHDEVEMPISDACAKCVNNEFGSAPNGKGKACRNMVRFAIVPPDADVDTLPMILEIPPSSLKNWNRLVNDLEATGLLPIQVVTEIAFDTSKSYPCPTFKVQQSHDALPTFWAIREKATALLDQTPNS
jgi:hypothetical protein